MNPKNRVITVSILLTVIFIISITNTLIPYVVNLTGKEQFTAYGTLLLASTGLYRALITIFSFTILEVAKFKEWVFGVNLIEGTWVGYYKEGNDSFYLVEAIEQDFDQIVVRGSSYDAKGERIAQWTSESAEYDSSKGVFQYSYICHLIEDKNVEQGLANFSVIRDNKSKKPKNLYGYSTDVHDGHRAASWEQKIDAVGKPPEECLKAARAYKIFLEASRTA
tara:strand:+ start:362 stop:1027 length:666 start_codon:yes stop_codon:yes gene_type:complete